MIGLLVVLTTSAFAQEFSQNYWHNGEVHLKDTGSEPLVGKIQYNLETDQIQLTQGRNRVKSFHASQLSYVKFKDRLEGTTRHFFALPIRDAQGYTRIQLFELLIEGEVSLLSREKIVRRVQQVYDPYRPFSNTISTQVLEETYYLADATGEIREVGTRKGNLAWQAFPDMQDTMKSYYENERINVAYRDDMYKMVTYYNNLKRRQ